MKNDLESEVSILRERIASLEKMSVERDHRYEDRFVAMDQKTSLALTSSEKAVTKAEIAQEKRFDNTNEWRAAMQDRDRNQMPRVEIEQRFAAIGTSQKWVITTLITVVLGAAALIIAFLKR